MTKSERAAVLKAIGRQGGLRRAQVLTKARMSEIGKMGAAAFVANLKRKAAK